MTARVSVVLPVRNGEPYLRYQLDALARQRCPFAWEVIVVDNGSTDTTSETARTFAGRLPGLQVLHVPEPGKGLALNAGVAAASGEHLVFLDADDEVGEGYLEAMSRALEEVDLVGSRIDVRLLNVPWAQFAAPPDDRLPVPEEFLPFAPGGTLGVRAELARRLGSFATDMPLADDVDFCWRAVRHGATTRFVPEAVLNVRRPEHAWGAFMKSRGYGRSHVLLYRAYRDKGLRRRRFRLVRADIVEILVHVKRHQPHWTWRAAYLGGFLAGRIEQSIRSGVYYL